jgi:hypothetical protein
MADVIHESTNKLHTHTPALPPLPPHSQAINHLLASFNPSKGGPWLSDSDFNRALQLFEDSDKKSATFNALAVFDDSGKRLHSWLQAELEVAGVGASTDAPMDEDT